MDARLKSSLASRYVIEREIGRGGMATVYLARDVRHARNVALKVLNPELGAVLGVERFLAEIQVTANLQHPNLLPLFDSGEAEGLLFYVMPYVEGESLRGRLEREKQLPIDDAVRITIAVCSALDHAHRHGVIHRDLKPENILLYEGQPLIADFGIALAVSVAGGNRVTQTGISLGTPQYMSPEQATGDRAVDGRSDVYSLGCVLYEMLTGEPPHIGQTVQSIIAKVLTDKPQSVRVLRDMVPEHVDVALQKALAKLPADRWATASQFADALAGKAGVAALPAQRSAQGRAVSGWRERARDPLVLGLGAVALAAIAVAAITSRRPPQQDTLPARFDIALPANISFDNIYKPLTISPDGRHVIFRVVSNGSVLLARRGIDDVSVGVLHGTENGGWPFVSRDSRWVAYLAGDQLRKTPITGGPTTVITRIQGSLLQGAAWGPDNSIVLGSYQGSPTLSTVPAAGGTPRPLTTIDSAAGELTQRSPVVLDDEETILYVSWTSRGLEGARIGVASLKTGRAQVLDVPGTHPLGFVHGHLLYMRADGALMALPFNLRRREVTGEPVVVLEGININPTAGAARIALGGSTLVYLGGASQSSLTFIDSAGGSRAAPIESRRYSFPAWSPDGRFVAVGDVSMGLGDVWLYDVASSALTRLTYDGGGTPMWSHDGRHVIFIRRVDGRGTVWRRVADGSAPAEKLYEPDVDIAEALLAPDNRTLVYRTSQASSNATARDIYSVELPDGKPQPLLASRFNEVAPRLSRDGKWLAYQSDESGTFQVYVRPFPGGGAVTQVSVDGGIEPVWSRDGRRLFYRRLREIIAADVSTTPSFRVVSRRALLEGSFLSVAMSHAAYDVSADGRQFAVLRTDETGHLTIVLNWTEELRERLAK